MRGILGYKKFEGNNKKWIVQFLTALYNSIDIIYYLTKVAVSFKHTRLVVHGVHAPCLPLSGLIWSI
jgi:hypothetical protein